MICSFLILMHFQKTNIPIQNNCIEASLLKIQLYALCTVIFNKINYIIEMYFFYLIFKYIFTKYLNYQLLIYANFAGLLQKANNFKWNKIYISIYNNCNLIVSFMLIFKYIFTKNLNYKLLMYANLKTRTPCTLSSTATIG